MDILYCDVCRCYRPLGQCGYDLYGERPEKCPRKKSDNMDKDRPDLKNYTSGNPVGSISVNIDEWMKQAHGPAATPKSVEQEFPKPQKERQEEIRKAREAQAEYKENYLVRNERIARQANLTDDKHECSECGKTEFFYKDDYMCYQCRERLDAG